ncbi:MAG: hypothetical protein JXQ80_04805 [Bacteroidales bacterium]|nr:hypothetical protein [Bacteroidales bacterium]
MKTVRIPYIYTLIYFLAGLATACSFPLFFRQLTLVLGTHTIAKGSILLSALLSTAIGSLVGARLSEKTDRPLLHASVFTAIAGLFFVISPVIIKGITGWFLSYGHSHHPGPLSAGFFRFGISFMAFILPSACFGCFFPLVSKQFIPQLNQIGRYASTGIIMLATGLLIGMMLASYLLIPAIGINVILVTGGILFIATAVTGYAYLFGNKLHTHYQALSVSPVHIVSNVLRFRKKKYVPEAGTKLTRAILRVFALEGFGIAAILFTGQRILIQYNLLKPIFFNVHFFAVVFAGIIGGALLYKPLLEKPANKHMSFATLRIISGLAMLLSYVLLILFPENTLEHYSKSSSYTVSVLMHSFIFAALMFIPAVLLGLSIPLAFRAYPRRVRHIGNSLGHMIAVLLISIAISALLVVLIVIPILGSHFTIILTAVLIVLSGIYLLYKDSRLIRAFRVGYALLVFLLLIFSLGILHINREHKKDITILKKREGMSVSVIARYVQAGEKKVYVNSHYAFGTDKQSMVIQQAAALIPNLLNLQIRSAVVTGFGTGITAAKLESLEISHIHITEPHGEIIKVSEEVFANENNDIITSSTVKLNIEDPHGFLTRLPVRVDLITQGCNQLYDIPGMFHVEYFRQCRNLLTANGMLCQLIPVGILDSCELKSIINACSINFATTTLWLASADYALLIATREPLSVNYCTLHERFAKLNESFLPLTREFPDAESFLASFLLLQQYPIPSANANNRPYVEFNPTIPLRALSSLPFLLKQQPGIDQWLVFDNNCESSHDDILLKINLLHTLMKEQLFATTSEMVLP